MKDIPISKVIELSKNYSPGQIELILKDEVCEGVPSSEIITIYERATKLEEANAPFDEIYGFIYTVAQPKDIKKMKTDIV